MEKYDYEYIGQLVRKAQQNNSDAFAELYVATYQKQYWFVYQYVKDTYLAQDILQEIYIVVFKNIKKLKNPMLFLSWLHQITFRVCFHAYKKRVKEEQELKNNQGNKSELLEKEIEENYPERLVMLKKENDEIMEKVLSLPTKEAQVIIMRYYNEMTIEEIAKAMCLGRSTIKRYLEKGKGRLEKLLNN